MRNSTEEKQAESKSLTNKRTNIQGRSRQASKPELGLKSRQRERITQTVTQSPFARRPKRRTNALTWTGKSKTELRMEKEARPESKKEPKAGKNKSNHGQRLLTEKETERD
jgi:hypothetical protein